MNPYKNKKERLKESLSFQILSGNLKSGDRLPSERLLGQSNNLSRVTVRNALAELENEGVIEKRGRKGIFVCGKPEMPPPVNAGDKPRRILYIYFPSHPEWLDINTVSFSSIFRGIDKYVNARNDIAMLLRGDSFFRNSEEEKRAYDGFIAGGILLHKHLPEIMKLNIPVVAVASFIPGIAVDSVSIDFYEGGYVAAKRLNMEGCKKLLFLGTEYLYDNFIPLPIIREKYRGISDYCLMNNMAVPILYNVADLGDGPPVPDKTATRKLIRIIKTKGIDGIICVGGDLWQTIEVLKNELSVQGYPFPVTAVFNDGTGNMAGKEYIQVYKELELCGFYAAQLLYERLKNPCSNIIKKLIPVKLPE